MNWPAEAVWEAVAPLLPGFTVEVLPQVDSTSTELMRRARAGQAEPVLLVAEQQTAGRGRLGRSWHSGPSGDGPPRDASDPSGGSAAALAASVGAPLPALTFSLGLPLAPADWSGLSLAVGVSLAESLHPDIRLKWPNDLWLDDRKLGGILIETASSGQAGQAHRYAVVGVGINLGPREAAGLSTAPAWLRELMPGCKAGQVLLRVVPGLVQTLLAFQDFGFAPFQARFNARDALRDRPVVLSDGTAGTAHGASESGALLVHTAGGMKPITSSEVSVRPSR